MIDLDNLDIIKANDPQDMLDRISDMPAQLREAWAIIQAADLPAGYRDIEAVVVTGMGGSAIGGSLVAALAEPECPVPIVVNRDYHLPAFINQNTLVVASSFSGNTEETLATAEEALAYGAHVMALTTGGRLAQMARQRGFPVVTFGYQSQPRAALGYSFTLLLGLLTRLGLLEDKADEITEAADVLQRLQRVLGVQVSASRNPAKDLARRLHGHVPTVYGSGILIPVARRWKGQFNENAKHWAGYDEMPELDHNSVVGYQHPAHLNNTAFVIMLRCGLDHPRVQARFDITAELLEEAGIDYAVVNAWGEGPVAQMLSTVYYGDYVSYYLAMLNEVDPTPVASIDHLKHKLADL